MSQAITIKGLDEKTSSFINREAERSGASTERVILQFIRKGIEFEHKNTKLQTYHDLDSLAGTWSDKEASEFIKAISDFNIVDEELWQ
jgi:phosphopantetheinyl transferase (holo-ACP synthase)